MVAGHLTPDNFPSLGISGVLMSRAKLIMRSGLMDNEVQ